MVALMRRLINNCCNLALSVVNSNEWREVEKRTLAFVCFIFSTMSITFLHIVPLIRVGPHVDFVMRASIPALVVLFVLVMDTLASYLKERNLFFSSALIITLALGGLTAQHEIMRTIVSTTNSANDPAVPLKATEIDLFEDGARGNFFGEYEDSFFFKHIAKK